MPTVAHGQVGQDFGIGFQGEVDHGFGAGGRWRPVAVGNMAAQLSGQGCGMWREVVERMGGR